MVLLIDNYDSFSYNLVQLVGSIAKDGVRVVRNDVITLKEIEKMKPSHIILSPGPGRPVDAGICEDVVRTFNGKIPILGVCLGHQAICEVFGADITYAKKLMHGKQSIIEMKNDISIFEGLENEEACARYHSLAADKYSIPDELEIIARDKLEGEVMAVKHREYEVYGVQFHPESVLTPNGHIIIENFLNI